MKKVIAIDFDGCLCTDAWPEIGRPYMDVISKAKHEQENGAALILWTCREGKLLRDAVNAAARWGLTFDAVNDNIREMKARYNNNPRKIGATEYWDDRAICMPPKDAKAVFNNYGSGGTFIDNVDGTVNINL